MSENFDAGMNTTLDVGKFRPLRGLLEVVAGEGLNASQGRALLNKLSRIQRLAIAELVMNIVFCRTDHISERDTEKLIKYENQLRRIALSGRRVTNRMLARHQMAVKLAIQVALTVLDKGIPVRTSEDDDKSDERREDVKEEKHEQREYVSNDAECDEVRQESMHSSV